MSRTPVLEMRNIAKAFGKFYALKGVDLTVWPGEIHALMGENGAGTFARVHFPLLRPALVSSALLVFADAMKELPTTLLLRPVNFETLATLLYAEAARGTYEEGAIAALMIVLAGTLPVILLVRHQMTRRG